MIFMFLPSWLLMFSAISTTGSGEVPMNVRETYAARGLRGKSVRVYIEIPPAITLESQPIH